MIKHFRSSCIIASALDLIGDKWSLLIIRDMLLHKKTTYKEFASSGEGIATNLLSTRLKLLHSLDIITKRKLPTNKKENIYLLTNKGIDLAPLIMEVVLWSDKYVRPYNSGMNQYEATSSDKSLVIENVKQEYRKLAIQILEI